MKGCLRSRRSFSVHPVGIHRTQKRIRRRQCNVLLATKNGCLSPGVSDECEVLEDLGNI